MKRIKLTWIGFVLCFLVFVFQPYKVGFEKSHHGWVSSHVLAQITNAYPKNYFLGYTQKYLLADGKVDYDYFDRYPVIFSGLSHVILAQLWDNLSSYIYFARQWMNVIFLITALLIFRLVYSISRNKEKGVIITFLTMSSALFIHYKDMIHFDQPAILGCLIALNGIVDYEMKGAKKFLFLGALIGPLLGRGYAVIFFLCAWVIVRLFENIMMKVRWKEGLKIPVLFFLLSIPLPSGMLLMNVIGEARIRDVNWTETSIVVSASRRLGVKAILTEEGTNRFKWLSFINSQIQRFGDLITPYPIYVIHQKDFKKPLLHYTTILPKIFFQLFLLYLFFKHFGQYWRKQDRLKKRIFLTLTGSGFFWILAMRNLAYFHEYVSMYFIGAIITLWFFFYELMEERKLPVTKIALSFALTSILINFGVETYRAQSVNWQSGQMMKIRSEFNKRGVKSFYAPEEIISGVPYFNSFMLSGFAAAKEPGQADVELKFNERKVSIKD